MNGNSDTTNDIILFEIIEMGMYRVLEINCETKETLFISDAVPFEESMDIEKEQLKTMPNRNEGKLILFIAKDSGTDGDYLYGNKCMLFTDREALPFNPFITYFVLKNVPYDSLMDLLEKYNLKRVLYRCDPSSKTICIVYEQGIYYLHKLETLWHLMKNSEPGQIKFYEYEDINKFIEDTRNA